MGLVVGKDSCINILSPYWRTFGHFHYSFDSKVVACATLLLGGTEDHWCRRLLQSSEKG